MLRTESVAPARIVGDPFCSSYIRLVVAAEGILKKLATSRIHIRDRDELFAFGD